MLLGEGTITETKSIPTREPNLFQSPNEPEAPQSPKENNKKEDYSVKEVSNQLTDNHAGKVSPPLNSPQPFVLNLAQSMSDLMTASVDNKEVERIVLFFKDKTFSAYTPSK